MKECLIIGLTGRFGAGCTRTAEFFVEEQGCTYISVSEVLKDQARKEYKNFNEKPSKEKRKILQNLGDSFRKKDIAALVLPIIKQIRGKKLLKVVIDALRNPGEIKQLKKAFSNFSLIAIDATTETRWRRLKHLYNSRKEFQLNDERDEGKNQPKYGQKVKDCIEMADILINSEEDFYLMKKKVKNKIKKTIKIKNNVAIDRYGQKLSDYLSLINKPGIRKPNADEIYMHFSCSIALKSECLQRQVGATIVKDGYIIAMGCNNVPRGEDSCEKTFKGKKERCYRRDIKSKFLKQILYCKNCGKLLKELKCKKCKTNNAKLPGKLLDLCRSVHAEEAAILQTAKLGGISLDNTVLYASTFPCMLCCKKIIDSGVKKIVYLESYPMGESLSIPMFEKCGIQVTKFEGVNAIAFHKLFKK